MDVYLQLHQHPCTDSHRKVGTVVSVAEKGQLLLKRMAGFITPDHLSRSHTGRVRQLPLKAAALIIVSFVTEH